MYTSSLTYSMCSSSIKPRSFSCFRVRTLIAFRTVSLCPSADFKRAFSTCISTGSLPFFMASEILGNRFFQSYSVPGLIPMTFAISSSVSPSRAYPSSRRSPSSEIQFWYFPVAIFNHSLTSSPCRILFDRYRNGVSRIATSSSMTDVLRAIVRIVLKS